MRISRGALTASAAAIAAGAAAPAGADTTATCRVEARLAPAEHGMVARRVEGLCAGWLGTRPIPSTTFAMRDIRTERAGSCPAPVAAVLEILTPPLISFGPRPEGPLTRLRLDGGPTGAVVGSGTTEEDAFAAAGAARWAPRTGCAGTWALKLVMRHTGPRPAAAPARAEQPAPSERPARKGARKRPDARKRHHREGRRHA